MSSRDGEQLIDGALSRIDSQGSLAEFARNSVVGGIIWAFALNVVEGIDALGGLVRAPFVALFSGVVGIIDATFGGFVDMIETSTEVSVSAQLTGTWRLLGPFQPVIIMLIVFGSMYILFVIIDRTDFNPLSLVPGRG